ncbi:MAG: hypothetical protein IJV41_11370 [Oscillospiraceae bacterium]|nr:hypothetical protein [Oscillospiraceae bacterium]
MGKRNMRRGKVIYALALFLWCLLLIGAAGFGLMKVADYAAEYEASRPSHTMDAYIATLGDSLLEGGIADTIAAMPHEVQTDEEVAQHVSELLSNGISYVRKGNAGLGGRISYSLRCNGNEFGTVTLVEDESLAQGKIDLEKWPWKLLPWKTIPWRVESESFDFTGLYSSVEVVVPRTYHVYLNGIELGPEYIVEEDIPYNVLEKYYDEYEGLPTKVRYRFDDLVGVIEPVIRDEDGAFFVIDPNADDGQFIRGCSQSKLARLAEFTAGFVDNYLKYTSGVVDPTYGYQKLQPYLVPGADLDQRMVNAMDGLSWAHTSSLTVDSSTLNGALNLGDGFYLCDITATATTFAMGHGEVETVSNMRVIVREENDDIRAISLELY